MDDGQYEHLISSEQKVLLTETNLSKIGKSKWLCPYGVKFMSLAGDIDVEDFKYVKIAIKGCQLGKGDGLKSNPQDECLSDDELSRQVINFLSLSSQPSLRDVDKEPVSYTVNKTYFKFIHPELTQSTNIFYMNSQVYLNDNIYDIFDIHDVTINLLQESGRFDYIQKISKETPVSEREYISLFLRAANERQLYFRDTYDMLTYLGDLGGLIDIVMVVGYLLTTLFASKLLAAAVIGQVYRIQSYMRDESQYYTPNELYQLTSEESSQPAYRRLSLPQES